MWETFLCPVLFILQFSILERHQFTKLSLSFSGLQQFLQKTYAGLTLWVTVIAKLGALGHVKEELTFFTSTFPEAALLSLEHLWILFCITSSRGCAVASPRQNSFMWK